MFGSFSWQATVATVVVVAVLCATLVPAANAVEVQQFGFGCFNCHGEGGQRTITIFFSLLAKRVLANHPNTNFSLFDMGTGSVDSFRDQYATLVQRNYSYLLLETALPGDGFLNVLERVHDERPNFCVVILINEMPPQFSPPFVSYHAIRQDQTGFLTGYAAGLLSTTGYVGGRTNFGFYWLSRLFHAGFNVGVRTACPLCDIDFQHTDSSIQVTNVVSHPGVDTMAVFTDSRGREHISKLVESYPNVTTIIPWLIDVRGAYNDTVQRRMPYAVAEDFLQGPLTALDAVARGLPFESGTVLLDAHTGAITIAGCRTAGSPQLAPCNDAGVSKANHAAFVSTFNHLKDRVMTTGVSLNADAHLTRFAHPTLRAFTSQSLADVYGQRTSWSDPRVVLVASWKFLILTRSFDTTWSYIHASHSLSSSPSKGILPALEGYTAASMTTFTVVFGGASMNATLSADAYVLQHKCSGFSEMCTMEPEAWKLSTHPSGGRVGACAVGITADLMFLHGGVGPGQTVLADSWLLNTTSGAWRRVRNGPLARHGHTCTAWRPDGGFQAVPARRDCVVVTSGVTHVYCLSDDTWHATSGSPPRSRPCVFTTPDNVYLFGGETSGVPSLWLMNAAGVWGAVTDIDVSFIPTGPMRCLLASEERGRPLNVSTAGRPAWNAVQELLRVYVFQLHPDNSAGTDDMRLVSLPWIQCAKPLHFAVGAFHCVADAVHGEGSVLSAAGVVGIAVAAIAVAALGCFVALFVTNMRKERAVPKVIMPPSKSLALCSISIVPSNAHDTTIHGDFTAIIHHLREQSEARNIYEVQCFAATITFAVAASEIDELMSFVMDAYEHVHAMQPPSHTLVSALHVGAPARRLTADNTKVTLRGETIRTVSALHRICRVGEINVSAAAFKKLKAARSVIATRCHMSDEVPAASSSFVACHFVLHPQCSTAVREAAIHMAAAQHVSRRSPTPAGDPKERRPRQLRSVRQDAQAEFGRLVLQDLFKQLPVRQRRGLLGLLMQRLELSEVRAGRDVAAAEARRSRTIARAIVRELGPHHFASARRSETGADGDMEGTTNSTRTSSAQANSRQGD